MRTVTVIFTCDPSVLLICFSGMQNSNLWQIHQIQNMNHKPQTLPSLTAMAAMAAFSLSMAALVLAIPAVYADEAKPAAATAADESKSTAEDPAAAKADTPAEAASSANLPAADEILTQLRGKLEGLDSLKCELHQTTLLSGMKLIAAGKYVEAAGNKVNLQYVIFPMVSEKPNDGTSLALDAEAPAVDESQNRGMLSQISDGSVLTTSWKNGEVERVIRRNISDILAAAKATTTYDPKNAAMDLGIGGLRGLISRLQTTMEFAPVKLVKAKGRDVYEVTGRWNEKVRKEIFKVPEDTIVDPRPQVPEYARVYVDVETMLPRRIQFLKRSMNPNEKSVRPLMTLDLTNLVINDAVDEQTFVFQPAENSEEVDQTEQVIKMIEQTLQPPAAAGTTPTPQSATPVKP